jgi:hypothetical protein
LVPDFDRILEGPMATELMELSLALLGSLTLGAP